MNSIVFEMAWYMKDWYQFGFRFKFYSFFFQRIDHRTVLAGSYISVLTTPFSKWSFKKVGGGVFQGIALWWWHLKGCWLSYSIVIRTEFPMWKASPLKHLISCFSQLVLQILFSSWKEIVNVFWSNIEGFFGQEPRLGRWERNAAAGNGIALYRLELSWDSMCFFFPSANYQFWLKWLEKK